MTRRAALPVRQATLRTLRAYCTWLLACVLLWAGPAEAQNSDDSVADWKLRLLSGDRPPNGQFYFPVGLHTVDTSDVLNLNMLGFSRNGLIAGTFLNSYGDQTFFAGRGQNILTFGRVGVDAIYGLMYGYQGKLTTSENLPDFLFPLFEGEINPFAAITPYYRFSEYVELRAMITPLFSAIGVGISLKGGSKPPPPPSKPPNLIFSLGGGAGVQPAYFGADSFVTSPKFSFSLEYLRLSKKRSFGSTDPNYRPTGLAPRFSYRLVGARSDTDHAELAGLDDIGLSIELGAGLIYRQPKFEVFANARYGVLGHESWVGEMGMDFVMRPHDKLTLTLGPRISLGDDRFAATYFGVTPAESAASGLAAYAPSGGILDAGIEFGATYALNENWSLDGTLRYSRLMNDATASPIAALGSKDQYSLKLMLTRRFRTAVSLF